MGEKHPDETTIELYVLGSPMGDEERTRLRRHLEGCPSCRELQTAMRDFYRDLDVLPSSDGAITTDLPVRIWGNDHPLHPIRPGTSGVGPPHWRMVDTAAPIRMARWIVRHPLMTATGGLGALGLMLLLLIPPAGLFSPPPDTNPVNFRVRGMMVSIVNRSDSVLLTEQVSGSYARELENQDDPPSSAGVRILFADVDGDGRNEFLQVRNPGRPTDIPEADVLLRSVEDRSPIWRYPVSKHYSFPRKTEGNTPDFGIRTIDLGDYDGDGAPEVYVLSVHTHFPGTLAKLDAATGAELGVFVHIGHITSLQAIDLDGDGVCELVIGGRNNAFRRAFVAVLDPRRMDGYGPATDPYLPDRISPAAVRSYVLFPKTPVGAAIDDGELMEHVTGISVNRSETYLRVTVDEYNSTPVHASYTVVFDRSMNATHFQTGTEFDTLADSLARSGLLSRPVGPSYGKEFLAGLKYLQGDGWTTRSLSTRSGQEPGSPGTR